MTSFHSARPNVKATLIWSHSQLEATQLGTFTKSYLFYFVNILLYPANTFRLQVIPETLKING